jgi:hypothetical protein
MVVLKQCFDDDWAGDLRFASVVLMKHLLPYTKDTLDCISDLSYINR